MPAPAGLDAGTASQLIRGVRRTSSEARGERLSESKRTLGPEPSARRGFGATVIPWRGCALASVSRPSVPAPRPEPGLVVRRPVVTPLSSDNVRPGFLAVVPAKLGAR